MKIAATSADPADLHALVGHLYAVDAAVQVRNLVATPATATTEAFIEADVTFPTRGQAKPPADRPPDFFDQVADAMTAFRDRLVARELDQLAHDLNLTQEPRT